MSQIYYYLKSNQRCPIEIFFDRLESTNSKLYSKIFVKLDRLKTGCEMCTGDIKHVEGKIYELRVKQSTNISRIFYFCYDQKQIILLDGYIKKDNKTDPNVLRRVKTYYEDFLVNKRYKSYY